MELAQVQNIIESAPKGANIVLEWTRDAKVRKGAPKVRKMVRMVGRVGVEYDSLKSVQQKRSNGQLPSENQGLAEWAEWVQYPFVIRHKTKGTLYLRMYKGTSAKVHPSVAFLLDSKAVSFEAIEQHLLASEKRGHDDTDTFMVKISDLTRVWSETTDYGAIL